MKHWKIVIAGVLFFTIVYLSYYLEILNFLAYKIPFSVYTQYLTFKRTYSCGNECFYKIQLCTEKNSSKEMYLVSGGDQGGQKVDSYFDSNGEYVCHNLFSIDACAGGGGCPSGYTNCSFNLLSCRTITSSTKT